jgi:hypothetical protein
MGVFSKRDYMAPWRPALGKRALMREGLNGYYSPPYEARVVELSDAGSSVRIQKRNGSYEWHRVVRLELLDVLPEEGSR